MAKKWTASSEQLKPDPKYNSKLVSKFINCLMWDGKKSVAQQVFYDAMDIISKQMKTSGPQPQKKAVGSSSPPRLRGDESIPAKAGAKDGEMGSKDVGSLEVFETAINNVKPLIEVRSKRVGGASYQVPMQVSPKRQQSLAFRWITQSARGKKGKPMCQRLAAPR